MKLETKLKKIMLLSDSRLKLLKLYNLAFECMPNSLRQKEIMKEINNLINKGFTIL